MMMGWAREVEKRGAERWEGRKGDSRDIMKAEKREKIEEAEGKMDEAGETVEEKGVRMVKEWRNAALETVDVARKGDLVCLK